jgi:prevent-host-death family protein
MTIVIDHGHVMPPTKTIPAGEFKAKCLKLMDEVEKTGEELVITKRGKPIAKLVPAQSAAAAKRRSLIGCMKGTVTILGDIVEPALDPGWEEEWLKGWDELLSSDKSEK